MNQRDRGNSIFNNRKFEQRRDQSYGNYGKNGNYRTRVYANNYRPRYERAPISWQGRRYYSFNTYTYHPYRPYNYGSFFHPYGYVSLRLGPLAVRVNIGNRPYWYDQGVYYQPYDNGYQVVQAPEGAYIQQLPYGYSSFELEGYTYYYFAGTFYGADEQGYYVIPAPPGAIVYDLPEGAQEINVNGMTYLQYGDAIFQPITFNGRYAYEVVDLEEENGNENF